MEINAFPRCWPDGLDVDAIDAVIAEVSADLAAEPPPVLLPGGSARRDRREARRSMAAVVRSLPVRRPTPHLEPDGEAA